MSVMKKLQIILYFFSLLFFTPILFIIVLPLLFIIRGFVKICAKCVRLKEAQIIGGMSATLAVDKIYTAPFINMTLTFYLDQETDLDLFKSRFISNVIEKRKPCGKLQYPTLRKYVTEFMGYLFWTLSESFDPSNHFKLYKTGEVVDEEALQKLLNEIVVKPWVVKQPLWEFIMVENYQRQEENGVKVESGGKRKLTPVLIFNAHHSLLDGFSIVNILIKEMTSLDVDKFIAKPAPSLRKSDNQEKKFAFGKLCKKLSFPLRALYEISTYSAIEGDVNSWKKSITMTPTGRSSTFDNTIPLMYIKGIHRSYGVSFTTLLLAGVCGAIRRSMKLNSVVIPEFIHCCLILPMPAHPKSLTNHSTIGFLRLPIGDNDPKRRLQEIELSFQKLKKSIFPKLYFYMIKVLGDLPSGLLRKIIMNNSSVDNATVCLVNFPAPSEIFTINSSLVNKFKLQVGPMAGTALVYFCHSYNGRIQLSAEVDKEIQNSENISKNLITLLQEELDVLHQISMNP